jgi:hypothetical protein
MRREGESGGARTTHVRAGGTYYGPAGFFLRSRDAHWNCHRHTVYFSLSPRHRGDDRRHGAVVFPPAVSPVAQEVIHCLAIVPPPA